MTDPSTVGGTAAGEQGRARRWGLRPARMGVLAGSIAPAVQEDAGMPAVCDVARGESAVPQVTVVSVHGATAAQTPGRGRRLRWFGWIKGRVIHGKTGPKFT